MYTIFSKDACPYCTAAKELLTSKGIKFVEHTIGKNISKNDMIVALGREVRTVPQIVDSKGEYIGGYTDLVEKFEGEQENV